MNRIAPCLRALAAAAVLLLCACAPRVDPTPDRKSTRLNSSHLA